MTYEETLESFREAVGLGFSPREVIRDLENDEDTDKKALGELEDLLKYGV